MAFQQQKGGEVSSQSGMDSTASAPSVQSSTPTSAASKADCSDRRLPEERLSARWKCGAMLADGSFGCVYRAFDLSTGRIFVVKVHTMEDERGEDAAGKKGISERLSELEGLSHPNIVEHLGHEFADSRLSIYLEYVAGGSLVSMLREFGPLREPMLGVAASGLMGGLDYLHSREPPMVHGDVNSSNILVGDGWIMKLQCFQCSRHIAPKPDFASMDSLAWMAPEVFQGNDADETKADVWGAGCVILEMATAERPWEGVPLDEILLALGGKAPASPPLPAGLSPPVRACVAACLQPDAHARPSAAELLRMPLLAESERPRFGGFLAA